MNVDDFDKILGEMKEEDYDKFGDFVTFMTKMIAKSGDKNAKMLIHWDTICERMHKIMALVSKKSEFNEDKNSEILEKIEDLLNQLDLETKLFVDENNLEEVFKKYE